MSGEVSDEMVAKDRAKTHILELTGVRDVGWRNPYRPGGSS